MLNNSPILIAEDQTFIALDLAVAVEDAGGRVVGPAATVAEALNLLANETVDAAILDVDLMDGDCAPILQILADRRIPTIIQTGLNLPDRVAKRFPDLVVQSKPFVASELIKRLEAMIGQAAARSADEPPRGTPSG